MLTLIALLLSFSLSAQDYTTYSMYKTYVVAGHPVTFALTEKIENGGSQYCVRFQGKQCDDMLRFDNKDRMIIDGFSIIYYDDKHYDILVEWVFIRFTGMVQGRVIDYPTYEKTKGSSHIIFDKE